MNRVPSPKHSKQYGASDSYRTLIYYYKYGGNYN